MAGKFKKNEPSVWIENILLKISIFSLLSLIVVQIFLSNNLIRTIVGHNNNRNVIAIEESANYSPSGWIEIEIKDFERYEHINILKNGVDIEEDVSIIDDIIKLEVLEGDVIEIDTTKYEESIGIHILETSDNIRNPQNGQQYQSSKNILYLFKTEFSKENP